MFAIRLFKNAAVVILLATACGPKRIPVMSPGDMTLLGAYVLPGTHVTGKSEEEIGGLSGLVFDETLQEAVAVTDDSERPRLISLKVELDPEVRFMPVAAVPLEAPAPGRSFDIEGVAVSPGGHLFLTSEGATTDPEDQLPGLFEYTRGGRLVRQLHLPPAYAGLRPGSGLEGLAVDHDGRRLFVATENGLRQDGPPPTFSAGALSRILVIDLESGRRHEYAYPLDPVPPLENAAANVTGVNGLSEVVALGSNQLLVLERAFMEERSGPRSANSIRFYSVALEESAEVTGRWSMRDEPPRMPLKKTRILDLGTLAPTLPERLRRLENFEAMAFGPTLPDGRRSLLLLSDDNFGKDQVTALLVMALRGAGG